MIKKNVSAIKKKFRFNFCSSIVCILCVFCNNTLCFD